MHKPKRRITAPRHNQKNVSAEEGPESRIVIFELGGANGASRPAGVFADRVRDVYRSEDDAMEGPPVSSPARPAGSAVRTGRSWFSSP